ncbi:MAG: S41 family peptidase [Deltaproteobacteria bacterium]|nr:S41 family peptidase [Deltaproteobacteria bacterium]
MRWHWKTCLASALACVLLWGAPVLRANEGGEQLVYEVFQHLDKSYVARDHMDLELMLDRAMERLSRAYPEVLYTLEKSGGGVRLKLSVNKVQMTHQNIRLSDTARLIRLFGQIHGFLQSNLSTAPDPETTARLMVEGALSALDPHTTLLAGSILERFQTATTGKFGGVGLVVGLRLERLTVLGLVKDSPGAAAGVLAGDQITHINGQATQGMDMNEVQSLMHGTVGSKVTLLLRRVGAPKPLQVTLTRAPLRVTSVDSHLFSEGEDRLVGYLRIRSFQETTSGELASAIDQLVVNHPGFQGIVLDLRGNRGGVLEQGVRSAGMFVERGVIVKVRKPGQIETQKARWQQTVNHSPLVVLINDQTASAAEVMAAALKNNQRALVVGSRSYGKGSVQGVVMLSNGMALKLTIADYLTPGDLSIQGVGVVPDIALYPLAAGPDLYRLRLVDPPRAEAPFVLSSDPPKPPEKPLAVLSYLADSSDIALPDSVPLSDNPAERQKLLDHDLVITLGRNILMANGRLDYHNLAQSAQTLVNRERPRQQQKLEETLAAQGIRWSDGPNLESKAKITRVEVDTAQGSGFTQPKGWVTAGSRVRLTLTAANTGEAPLHRVLGVASSPEGLFEDIEFPLGTLRPGETRDFKGTANLPATLLLGVRPVELTLLGSHGQVLHQTQVFLPVRPRPRPRYRVTVDTFDNGSRGSKGNGDHKPQAGEILVFQVRLENLGLGESPGGKLLLGRRRKGSDSLLARTAFGEIKPDKSFNGALKLAVRQEITGPLSLFLRVEDSQFPEASVEREILLTPYAPMGRLIFQPPLIQVNAIDPVQVSPQTGLTGVIQDDDTVKEMVILANGRKYFYRPQLDPAHRQKLNFDSYVLLEKGQNHVVVEAWDQEGLPSRWEMNIWRGELGGLPVAGLESFSR